VKRLCDVGGRGVLCDGEGVIASARELLEARGVLDRVELAPGSSFEKVPPGCDAYMMKNILHDASGFRFTRVFPFPTVSVIEGEAI